jgi:hypothetical protein
MCISDAQGEKLEGCERSGGIADDVTANTEAQKISEWQSRHSLESHTTLPLIFASLALF